ncbi:Hydroxyproline-rich glycoprotein family protein [Quillaja saponaria]|uniref:Hydroxyproline-rich glycoprotein family protein n=1 Tax=Quillaja saponaria TaxID=32244 RepID=A0AAD7LX58_QUISA|nr:Hydroxyproline-rich glycoprotein family protein [Quillaja saponaria]
MEIDEETSSRVSISFPLGLALLLVMFLGMSGLFCCCLHWNKLRSLLKIQSFGDFSQTPADHNHISTTTPQKTVPQPPMTMEQNQVQSLPVLMPGDEVPKFIAMACPCRPPITIKVA